MGIAVCSERMSMRDELGQKCHKTTMAYLRLPVVYHHLSEVTMKPIRTADSATQSLVLWYFFEFLEWSIALSDITPRNWTNYFYVIVSRFVISKPSCKYIHHLFSCRNQKNVQLRRSSNIEFYLLCIYFFLCVYLSSKILEDFSHTVYLINCSYSYCTRVSEICRCKKQACVTERLRSCAFVGFYKKKKVQLNALYETRKFISTSSFSTNKTCILFTQIIFVFPVFLKTEPRSSFVAFLVHLSDGKNAMSSEK